MGLKISELIKSLQDLQAEHGDLQVEKACHETYGSIQSEVTGAEIEAEHEYSLKKIVVL